jgi:hypothetical protein
MKYINPDIKINPDVKTNRLESAVFSAPFDYGYGVLANNGYRIINFEQNSRLRMLMGSASDVSRNGNWVSEGIIYVPSKGIFLTKHSLIIPFNQEIATDYNRNGSDFILTEEQIETSLEENEITVYAFGNNAKAYGEFLKETGIDEMPICLSNLGDKPFTRQMCFSSHLNKSMLDGTNRFLHNSSLVRGIKYKAEGEK